MLLYVSASSMSSVLEKIAPESVPEHLEARFHKEREEELIKFREQQASHLFATLKVATLSDISSYATTSEKLDLLDFEHETIKQFRVPKAPTLTDFKTMGSEAFQISPHQQRFWTWAKRVNETFRLDSPIIDDDTTGLFQQMSHLIICSSWRF